MRHADARNAVLFEQRLGHELVGLGVARCHGGERAVADATSPGRGPGSPTAQ